ncbi:MAG: hypothetical protein J6B43_01265 [Lachnospiraceae bacterium]|nr:hypothetical protein [Lachnospiraceae bacterium]
MARIFGKVRRSGAAEAEIRDMVSTGGYYEDVMPLNTLYLGSRFAGLLYESDGSLVQMSEEDAENRPAVCKRAGNEDTAEIIVVIVQIVIAVALGVLHRLALYPIIRNFELERNASSVIRFLSVLDIEGIPAVLAGTVAQVVVHLKLKDTAFGTVKAGAVAAAANFVAALLWMLLLMVLMVLVDGAVAFLMRYLVIIVLIAVGIKWLKRKLRI